MILEKFDRSRKFQAVGFMQDILGSMMNGKLGIVIHGASDLFGTIYINLLVLREM